MQVFKGRRRTQRTRGASDRGLRLAAAGWEAKPLQSPAFWSLVPDGLKPVFTWYNVPVDAAANSSFNPLNIIRWDHTRPQAVLKQNGRSERAAGLLRCPVACLACSRQVSAARARELYRPGDFVVIKLDSGDGAADMELMRQVRGTQQNGQLEMQQ